MRPLWHKFDRKLHNTFSKTKITEKSGFHKILQILMWITCKIEPTIHSYSQSYPHYPHICG